MVDISLYQNAGQLLLHGMTDLRKDILEIVENGIKQVIPYERTQQLIRLEGDRITVGNDTFQLKPASKIFFVGAGKGSFPIAKAIDELFGSKIKRGVLVVKEGEKRALSHMETFESSHPLPDERSVVAAQKIIDILKEAGPDDYVIAAITGGSSAMVNVPPEGISIDEIRTINELLLESGAAIGKINALRKHVCMLKGGRLVQYAQPATVITLTLDTAPPDMPWPDLCLPDPTTFQDALDVVDNFQLKDSIPQSIYRYLMKGLDNPELETLKTLEGMKHHIYKFGGPTEACTAAADRARMLGYEPHILSTSLEGEAKDLGIFLAGISNEIVSNQRPFSIPCALISGGETTVTIHGKPGKGGPNQESALGFALKIAEQTQACFLSVDTDGTDGPCEIAGGLVDSDSKNRASELGIDLLASLQNHDSGTVLQKLEDAVITGHTGTNVMNLRVVLIGKARG
ncbi:MAG: glycerate kinase [Sphaerochaetaceae bacterium]